MRLLWTALGAGLLLSPARAADGPSSPSAAAVARAAAVPAIPAPLATVSFSQPNGLIMLPGTINGSGPFTFLLDTGYDFTVIHPSLVDSLNLRRAGRITIFGIAGEEEEAPTVHGDAGLRASASDPGATATLTA